jgi:DNA topoisomerase-1
VRQQTTGVPCPTCKTGELIARRSKRGKTFYGCNRYPECDFVAWAKPLAESCPECHSPYLVEKFLKSGHFAECPNKECKYRRELPPEPPAEPPAETPAEAPAKA